ncbi:MAG: hypothetical protein ACXVB4_18380 [Pseudobdellovibrionaceae bacterium]
MKRPSEEDPALGSDAKFSNFKDLVIPLNSVAPSERGSSNSLTVGARIRQVDEPLLGLGYGLFRSQAILQVEFEEIAEPKGLSPAELRQITKKHGSYVKAADAIGASEAFVRQNAQQKRKGRNYGKTH